MVPDPESDTATDLPESTARSPDKQRLVVLPFTTVSHNPETEELADGLTDVVINTLSRTGQSEIVDRASAFSFKGQSPRPAEVSKTLGAQHVLQGSVQQSGNRVRITAELFDAEANTHVWSERFDRKVNDVFQLQDDIAKRITQSIRSVVVYGVDWEAPTDSFDAWLLNIQCAELYYKGSAEDNRQARSLAEQVMELDPSYCWGATNTGVTHWYDCIYGWSKSPESSLKKAIRFVEETFRIDTLDAFPWKWLNRGGNLSLQGEHDRAVENTEKFFELLPDDGGCGQHVGLIHCLSGEPKRAQMIIKRSLQSNSHPIWNHFEWLGLSHLLCGDQRQALSALDSACTLAADPSFSHALKAVACIELDQPDRAHAEMKQALEHRPELTLKHFHYYLAFRDQAQR